MIDTENISLIKQLNIARFEPRNTAQRIRKELKPKFKGTDLIAYNQRIQTFEGQEILDDMVNYMSFLKSVPPLTPSYPLSNAATQIAKMKGKQGRTDNQQPKRIYDLIKINGHVNGKIGELVCLKGCHAQQIASYFLMDDGLATRKRRRMLLDPQYRYIGVGSAPHSLYGTITIILLAEAIIPMGIIIVIQKMKKGRSGTMKVKSRKLVMDIETENYMFFL